HLPVALATGAIHGSHIAHRASITSLVAGPSIRAEGPTRLCACPRSCAFGLTCPISMPATVHVLRQIDVGDSIHLEIVGRMLGKRDPTRGTPVLRGPERAPSAGVVLRREPLDLKLGRVDVGSFSTDVRARMFDFGVIAFRFTIVLPEPTAAEW